MQFLKTTCLRKLICFHSQNNTYKGERNTNFTELLNETVYKKWLAGEKLSDESAESIITSLTLAIRMSFTVSYLYVTVITSSFFNTYIQLSNTVLFSPLPICSCFETGFAVQSRLAISHSNPLASASQELRLYMGITTLSFAYVNQNKIPVRQSSNLINDTTDYR